jgi:solute carrier family 25 (mitochondrial carnitine/acylcarnitine transporter), member 20/29
MAAPLHAPRASFIAVARRTYHSDGLKGFYRGVTPTILRAFPTNASAYFAYETIMNVLSAEKVNSLAFLLYGNLLYILMGWSFLETRHY